jgi:hypothetical protein
VLRLRGKIETSPANPRRVLCAGWATASSYDLKLF